MRNNSEWRGDASDDATNGAANGAAPLRWPSPPHAMAEWLARYGQGINAVRLVDGLGKSVAFPRVEEWQKRTSITWASRSARLKKVDACYAAFLQARSRSHDAEDVIAKLRDALWMLCTEEGGWAVSPRNRASGGLIARLDHALERHVAAKPVTFDPQCDLRFAILWLLSSIDVEFDPLSIVQTVGKGITISASMTQAVGTVRGANLLPNFTTGASGFCDTMIEGYMDGNAEAAQRKEATGMSRFGKLRAALVKMLHDVFNSIVEDFRKKCEFFTGPSWSGLIDIVKTVVDYVMRFTKGLSNALTEGWEVVKGIGKIASELKHRWHRKSLLRGFQCRDGHLGTAIASMERAVRGGIIAEGVDTLASSVSVVVSLCVPMIGSLIVPISDALVWFYKFVMRMMEKIRIRKFLKRAADFFAQEPRAGVSGAERFQPARSGGSIVMQPERFNAFFDEGCQISPVIPMLVLNSGVCGDLFGKAVFPKTLSDAAYQSYARAVQYFDASRDACIDYLNTCGFAFSVKPGRGQSSGLIEMAWKPNAKIG